jgi:hypothetical protein
MARGDNRIRTIQTKITLPWPLYVYLDRLIKTGRYGATYTSAAERAIVKHIEHMCEIKEIKKLTEAELETPPAEEEDVPEEGA